MPAPASSASRASTRTSCSCGSVRPSVPLSPTIAEGYELTRYLCRLPQERGRLGLALRGRGTPDCDATAEGTEFASAFAFFRTAYPAE